MLDVSSSVVHDGTKGVYEFTLQDGNAKKFARDGTFSVEYVNGAGETRCRGDASVSAKDQRHDGEFHVEITFNPPCSRVKTTNETKATYTFKPAKGATITAAASSSGDLTTWDQSHLTEARLAKQADALKPAVTAETKRYLGLARLVPAPSGKLTKCPPDVAAQLQKAAPARLSYDDMLRFASRPPEPGHEQLGFTTEGVQSVMASNLNDPLVAATDARMDYFKTPAFVEVFRVSRYKPWRIISAGDKHGTYEHGELFGDVSIIDIAKKQVVCGGPLAVRTDKTIEGSPTDLTVEKNFGENYRTARSALEQKLVGGDIPPTP